MLTATAQQAAWGGVRTTSETAAAAGQARCTNHVLAVASALTHALCGRLGASGGRPAGCRCLCWCVCVGLTASSPADGAPSECGHALLVRPHGALHHNRGELALIPCPPQRVEGVGAQEIVATSTARRQQAATGMRVGLFGVHGHITMQPVTTGRSGDPDRQATGTPESSGWGAAEDGA